METSQDLATFVLHVPGHLDVDAGRDLLDELRGAAERNTERVEIDLQALEAYTPEGLEALSACGAYLGRFPGGVHVRTMGDVAREAYLTAFA